ncbi:MAG: flavodoxin domain-containing protein [Anaerosomatales bacterium]|nr:flavodoxin domain-containing protein [Anaerosomatales bacterium]
MEGGRRVLVVFATGSGCTESVAGWVAEEAAARGLEPTLRDAKSDPSPEGFDGVAVGSGLRAGKWHGAAEQWLKRHAERLHEVPCAVFSVGMRAVAGDASEGEATARQAAERAGIEPAATASLPGWFFPKRFSLPERLILKAMKTPEGDFRDEAVVRAWAAQALDAMGLS